MFIDVAIAERARRRRAARPAPAPSAGTPAARRRTCCCRPRRGRSRIATTPVTVAWRREPRQQTTTNRSMPSAFSSSAISTVTPHTMRIDAPRHPLDRLAVVGASASATRITDAGERRHADVDVANDQTRRRAARTMTAERHPVRAVEPVRPRRRRLSSSTTSPCAGEQLQAAEQEVAAERHDGVRRPGCRDRSAISWPRQPDPRHQPVDDDAGRRERRERRRRWRRCRP